MRVRCWKRLWTLGMVGMAYLGVTAVTASSTEPDKSVSAIRSVLDCQVGAWNKHDLDAFLDGYWHSPEVVFQSGSDRIQGWEAMRERYRKRYQGAGREMGRLAFVDVEISALGADSAFARGRWQLTMSDGASLGGLFTLIFRKFPEGWKIVHDHTSGS